MTMAAPALLAAILMPALICAGTAFLLRAPLRAASWITWMGYTLIGTGVPVLGGQGVALVVIQGGDPQSAPFILAVGLAGGLGWAAGAVSMRITGPKSED